MIASTLGMLFSIPGQTMGFSVFTEILMEDLGLSRVALSAAYFVGTVCSGLTLPLMGRLYDRWGGRKMAVLATIATAFVLFYLASVGRIQDAVTTGAGSAVVVSVGFVLIGLGFYLIRLSAQGVLTMSCRNVVGKWFDRKRGLALSLSGIIVSFAFSAAPRCLDILIERFSYEGAWIFLGLLTVGFMMPLAWLVFRDSPEECDMVMDGEITDEVAEMNPDMIIHHQYTRHEALRTFSFWAYSLSFSFYAFFSTAFTFHIISIGNEFGFAKYDIIALFIPMAAVSVSVSLFCGWINSKTRLKWILFAMNLGGVAGALGLLNLDTPAGKLAYVVGNGLCGGAFLCLLGLVWPRFYGRQWLGSINGVNMSLIVVASGIGPLLFGLAKQFSGSYFPALVFSVVLPAILAIASFGADNPQRKEKV
ncbi:MFS transporter [Verrucomicrobiales bacterium BCK34]|nr:MFS transporter [Verrucomicrobiales bacterium BCK34]